MGKRSYHGAMMNVQPKYPNGRVRMDCSTEYREGHRDARHACADIANNADAEIAALRERVARLEEWIEDRLDSMEYDYLAAEEARALLGEGGDAAAPAPKNKLVSVFEEFRRATSGFRGEDE